MSAWFVVWRQQAARRSQAKKKAKAGWYYDPRKQARYRRWDGSHWTGDTADELPS